MAIAPTDPEDKKAQMMTTIQQPLSTPPLPGSYVVVALIGAAWELILKAPRPCTYATIGLGTQAVTSQVTASGYEVRS